jgi:hypothetical protein
MYWLIFAAFALGAISYAAKLSRLGLVPVSGSLAVERSRQSVILGVAALALLLLIGLRFRVGGDWGNYLGTLESVSHVNLRYAIENAAQEPGYIIINWFTARLGLGMWFVNLLSALPFTYGLMRLARQQPNPWLALLIATPFLIIVVSMGYTRQAAAVGCVMAGLAAIIDRRPILHFIGWVLLGTLFHRTALVFVPIMLISSTKNKLVSYSLIIVSLALAYYTVLPAGVDRYTKGYVREELTAAGANVRVLMDVLPAVVILLFQRRFFWSLEEKAVWRTYAILCLIAGAALPFIQSSAIVDRLAIYLIPIQIFAYARIGYAFGLIRRGWLMWTAGVVLYSSAVLFVWLNYAINAFAWIPYQNYLTQPDQM